MTWEKIVINAYLTKERESLFLSNLESYFLRKSFPITDGRIDVKLWDINIYLIINIDNKPSIVYVFDRVLMEFHRVIYITNDDGEFVINPKTDTSLQSEEIQGLLETCKSYPRLDVFGMEVA